MGDLPAIVLRILSISFFGLSPLVANGSLRIEGGRSMNNLTKLGSFPATGVVFAGLAFAGFAPRFSAQGAEIGLNSCKGTGLVP